MDGWVDLKAVLRITSSNQKVHHTEKSPVNRGPNIAGIPCRTVLSPVGWNSSNSGNVWDKSLRSKNEKINKITDGILIFYFRQKLF